MTTDTADLHLMKVNVRDDETPIFTPNASHYKLISKSIHIKSIPYTLRRTEFRLPTAEIKTTLNVNMTMEQILSMNYILLRDPTPATGQSTMSERLFRIYDMEELTYRGINEILLKVVFDPMATASWIVSVGSYSSFKVKSVWSKVPKLPDHIESVQLRPDVLTIDKALAALPKDDPGNFQYTDAGSPIVYVQISGTYKDASDVEHFAIVGYFCMIETNVNNPSIYATSAITMPFPSISQIINEPEKYTPFTGNDIIDMSVSYKAPFSTAPTYDSVNNSVHMNIQAGIEEYGIAGPSKAYLVVPERMYSSSTVTVTLDSGAEGFEKACGSLQIRDGQGQSVGNIDMRHFADQNSITLTVETVGEYSGIYTTIYLPDKSKITMPEGHLPYNTSAYAQYVAEQQQYDREMMQINKDKATADLINNSAGSLANGLLTGAFSGGLGAATALIGIAGNIASYAIDQDAIEREQKAKEKQIQATADSSFGTAYGLSYIKKNPADAALRRTVCLLMPKSVTSSEFAQFVKDNGYPVTNLYAEYDLFSNAIEDTFILMTKGAEYTLTPNGTPSILIDLNYTLLGRWCNDHLRAGIKMKRSDL